MRLLPVAPEPLTPEERLGAQAARYATPDGVEALTASVSRRLAYRLARSGRECDRCALVKPVSAFGQDSQQKDGLRRYCRECVSAIYRSGRVNVDSSVPRPSTRA